MTRRGLLWVDIGMAVAVGVFIAIVAFARDSERFVALMVVYATVLLAWALIAEWAASRAEAAEVERRWEPVSPPSEPLPH